MHRVQFDIDDNLYNRMIPFIKNKKALGTFGLIAVEEFVKRREARTGRALSQDEAMIEKIVRKVLEEDRNV